MKVTQNFFKVIFIYTFSLHKNIKDLQLGRSKEYFLKSVQYCIFYSYQHVRLSGTLWPAGCISSGTFTSSNYRVYTVYSVKKEMRAFLITQLKETLPHIHQLLSEFLVIKVTFFNFLNSVMPREYIEEPLIFCSRLIRLHSPFLLYRQATQREERLKAR
jgi:hypothetical protein